MKRFIKYIQNKYKNIFLYLLSIPNHMQREIYIERNTEPIVISSCFFLIPTIYSFYTNQYFYTTILLLTFGISANYWRKETIGFRRNLDLIFSKISFVIFLSSQVIYIHYSSPLLLGYPIFQITDISKRRFVASYISLILIGCFYDLSNYYYHRNNNEKIWIKYYMLFHLFCSINQSLILDGIREYKSSQI
jgi:hypothetical protein